MNEKANVSTELNAKQRKILEGLLKLPENRECADCKSKGPRWASVNLGIFVCMQCSGIHRSLGVHISKVRSATLDTWLPEQVAFIQSMGNEKANCYWEAELPPNYDRVGIENFIRAKYEEKRWVAKDSQPKSPSRSLEEKASVQWQRPGDRSGNGYASNSENSSEERKNFQASTRETVPATRISIPVPPKGPESVIPPPKSQQIIQKSEPVVSYAESAKQAADSSPAVSPPKVDFATDLFDMLSMDGPSENGSEAASADDNAWAGFQSAAEGSTADKTVSTKPEDNNTQSTSGIEDLFIDSPSLAPSTVLEKPKKDVKNDIMSLFDKSNVVSPFSVHQQQLAMLAQQQSLLMAAAAKSAGVVPQFVGNAQPPGPNGTNLPTQNWPNVGYQFPGVMMPAAGNIELQKYMHQIGNMEQTRPVGSSVPFPTSSTCTVGQNCSTNGVTPAGTSRTPSASPIPSATPTQSAKDYDFSSLTEGMFSKS
ncbi:ADP-ribosylation factor GTPase-activating protein AGD5-like [Camellia sinensis]|uniref:ADP-ribosylation factor GTPase-activating protein AGD5-like n=1 Tax=Camellia sinensis TaxID=4442 RepID=UPI001035A23F|nr:ADP-ribosylation factor GTPase-activating protein AGD5-like [Camellia sinensis]